MADDIGSLTHDVSHGAESTNDVSTTRYSISDLFEFVKTFDKEFTSAHRLVNEYFNEAEAESKYKKHSKSVKNNDESVSKLIFSPQFEKTTMAFFGLLKIDVRKSSQSNTNRLHVHSVYLENKNADDIPVDTTNSERRAILSSTNKLYHNTSDMSSEIFKNYQLD